MRERRPRARKRAQYNEFGDLVYRVGSIAGGTMAEDLGGVRQPANKAEAECFQLLRENGWTPTKRGWPDFFCVRGDDVCAVEVKPHKSNALSRNQMIVMGALSAKGIRCFLWSPDGGFEEVMGMTDQHRQPF